MNSPFVCLLKSRVVVALLGFLLGVSIVGGVAIAQTSGPDPIVACRQKNGSLRVVGTADECKSPETALTWSRQGPQGPAGPAGPEGPPGPSPAGRSCPAGQFVVGINTDGTLTCASTGGGGGSGGGAGSGTGGGGALVTFYADFDGDGYGDPASSVHAGSGSPPAGYVANSADCNDTSPAIRPGGPEIANQLDDDCDGMIDEGIAPAP